MFITHLRLHNWRNFRNIDVAFKDITYLIGANASGKSNFLDVFRFLREIAMPQGADFNRLWNPGAVYLKSVAWEQDKMPK